MSKGKLYRVAAVLFLMFISFLTGISVQKYGISRNQSRILDDTTYEKIYSHPVNQNEFGKPAEIYDPHASYIYITEPEKSGITGNGFMSYRYYWHYKDIADYLISNEAKETAYKIHHDFWAIEANSISEFIDAMERKRTFLKETLGIEELPSNGKIKNMDTVLEDDNLLLHRVELESRIKSISVPLYIAKPKNVSIKGVVISIHGYGGAPEKVLGLEPRDYTRQFGAELAKRGYIVYAPYILNVGDRNSNISALGMLYSQNTHFSIDLQKLLSVVDQIKTDPELFKLPIVTYGISYGGLLSLILAGIDKRIDIVISSNPMRLNKLFLQDYYALDKNITRSSTAIFNRPYQIYFSYPDLAKLIYPRPLVMEYGAYDYNPGSISIEEWRTIENIYKKHNMIQNLELVWFKGYHETAPQLIIPILDNLIKNPNGK